MSVELQQFPKPRIVRHSGRTGHGVQIGCVQVRGVRQAVAYQEVGWNLL